MGCLSLVCHALLNSCQFLQANLSPTNVSCLHLIPTALWGKESPEPMASAVRHIADRVYNAAGCARTASRVALGTGGKARHGTNVVWPGDLKVRAGIGS